MNAAFRVDASLDMGTGHVMRCLTLASAIVASGGQAHFICRDLSGHLGDLIAARGYRVTLLPRPAAGEVPPVTPHSRWLGVPWQEDANQVCAVLEQDDPVDLLVVDHYALEAGWERQLGDHCHRLFVIDDLADRSHRCDLLLDQNLVRKDDDYDGLVPADTTRLVGPRYALLRPEFAALRAQGPRRRARLAGSRWLISLGGVDSDDVTSTVLCTLARADLPADTSFTVVLGPTAPHRASVRKQATAMPWPTDVLSNVANMAELMDESDFAIGAAGATTWERCCLALPSITLVLAPNQLGSALALEWQGVAIVIDDRTRIEYDLIPAVAALRDPVTATAIADRSSALVDGLGVDRVMSAVSALFARG